MAERVRFRDKPCIRAMAVFLNLLIPMEHHLHNLHSHYNRTLMAHQHKILMVQVMDSQHNPLSLDTMFRYQDMVHNQTTACHPTTELCPIMAHLYNFSGTMTISSRT